jgi:5-methylcytosine-specific restriction endonuclease McrA
MNHANLVLLKSVSDSELLSQIRKNAAAERAAGLSVIYELREIRARRLDIRLGYPSLHRFCMEELKYSSGSAWRRIKAMEALEDLPELESKISEGELTLANVSQVQSFCAQQKSLSEKKAILDQVAGLSKRETEKVLASIAPLPERPEKVREIDSAKTELRVTLSAETIEQLDRVRGLISHALSPQASYAEVIGYLARLGVKRLDPGREVRGRKGNGSADGNTKTPAGKMSAMATVLEGEMKDEPAGSPTEARGASVREAKQTKDATGTGSGAKDASVGGTKNDGDERKQGTARQLQPARVPPGDKTHAPRYNSEPIPAAVKRYVWRRDQGRCGYVCPTTGRVCASTHFVQFDHIILRAHGGSNEPSNLRLRCEAHNLLAAEDALGVARVRMRGKG